MTQGEHALLVKGTALWLPLSHPTAALGEEVEGVFNSTVQHPDHIRTAGSSLLLSLETLTITLDSNLIFWLSPNLPKLYKISNKNQFNLNQEKMPFSRERNFLLSAPQMEVPRQHCRGGIDHSVFSLALMCHRQAGYGTVQTLR